MTVLFAAPLLVFVLAVTVLFRLTMAIRCFRRSRRWLPGRSCSTADLANRLRFAEYQLEQGRRWMWPFEKVKT